MSSQYDIFAHCLYNLPSSDQSADDRLSKLVQSTLLVAFSSIDELLYDQFIEGLIKGDHSATSIDLLVVLDIRIGQIAERLPSLAKTLTNLKKRLQTAAEQFVIDQVAVIDSMKFTARKRSGVFPFVAIFPNFIVRMERIVAPAPEKAVSRETLNRAYERLTSAIFRSLDALLAEAERSADEKERINASVMNIQNGYFLVTQLGNLQRAALETSLRLARDRYEHHLLVYSSLSLHRPFGRLIDFFHGINTMLDSTPPEEVAFHASYNKASARRILTAFPLREIRKSLETLHGRVIKHFADDRPLQQAVWRALQDRFLAESTSFVEIIGKVYPGSDIQLSYSIDDALASFGDLSRF